MSDHNEIIFERVMNGESPADLAREYNISRTRVCQIVKREEDRQRINNDPLYQVIYKAVEELGYNTSTMTPKIFNKLCHANINIEDLKDFNLDEWKQSRHVGPAFIEVLEKIKEQK